MESLWSLSDQGIVSAGNFLTTIILARALPVAQYGIFVLIFGILLVLHTVQGGLITYPLSVKGAASDHYEMRRLTSRCLILTLLLLLPFSGVLFLSLLVLRSLPVFFVVLAACLCWELQETVRRGIMSHRRYRDALPGDLVTYGGQVGSIAFLSIIGPPSLEKVFACMAGAAGCGLLVHMIVLRPAPIKFVSALGVLRPFWKLGRWALLANSANATTLQSFLWVVARNGSSQAGIFQALMNLLAFTNPIAFSLGNVVVPAVAHARARRIGSGRHLVWTYLAQGLVLLLPYYLFLTAAPGYALRLFYGPRSSYLGFPGALRILVAAFAISYIAHLLGSFLFGAEDSAGVFRAQMLSSLSAVIVGLPLTMAFGVIGAAFGLLLVHSARGLALLRRFGRIFGSQVTPWAPAETTGAALRPIPSEADLV